MFKVKSNNNCFVAVFIFRKNAFDRAVDKIRLIIFWGMLIHLCIVMRYLESLLAFLFILVIIDLSINWYFLDKYYITCMSVVSQLLYDS